MVTSNGSSAPIPPWLSGSNPASLSVTLSLASSNVVPGGSSSPSPIPWLNQQQQVVGGPGPGLGIPDGLLVTELVECCRELEEGHRVWAAHRKEAAWRVSRVELQMESEKACRRREKMEEVEAKVKALREEQQAALERIEAEYREQLAGLRRDAEAKEQKLAEQWVAKHARLTKFLDQLGCRAPRINEPNGR